jgi:hypothetical protein
MKKILFLMNFLLAGILVTTAQLVTVTVTERGGLTALLSSCEGNIADITELKVISLETSHRITPGNLTYINEYMSSLEYLDLSQATIAMSESRNDDSFPTGLVGNTTIKRIIFPNNLVSTVVGALQNTALEAVILPEGVTNVGRQAFLNATKIKIVVLPSTILPSSGTAAGLGNNAFDGCTGIEQYIFKAITPAKLENTAALKSNAGTLVGVPASAVQAYRNEWGTSGSVASYFADDQIVAYRNITFENGAANTGLQGNVAISGTTVTVATTETNRPIDHWESSGAIIFTTIDAKSAYFTMPDEDITVRAVYTDELVAHNINITDGIAKVDNEPVTSALGDILVSISPSLEAWKSFTHWTATGVTLTDPQSPETTFTMPWDDVTVTANYIIPETVTATITDRRSSDGATGGIKNALTAAGYTDVDISVIKKLKVVSATTDACVTEADLAFIRTDMLLIEYLDLSQASITSTASVSNGFPENGLQSGNNADLANKTIKTLIFPTTMTGISRNALRNTQIEAAILPEGFTTIGAGAFFGCTALQTVVLPSTLYPSSDTDNNHIGISGQAFAAGSGIKQFIFKATTPAKLAIGSNTIPESTNSNSAFYHANAQTGGSQLQKVGVPIESLPVYKAEWGSAGYKIFPDNLFVAFRKITFQNGATSPEGDVAIPGTTVTVVAEAGKTIYQWTSNSSAVVFSGNTPAATFVMPDADITIAPIYEEDRTPYAIAITGGIAKVNDTEVTQALPGATVVIVATPAADKLFNAWTATGVALNNASQAETSFIMPANEVSITAGYLEKVSGTIVLTEENPRLSNFDIEESTTTHLVISSSDGTMLHNEDFTELNTAFPLLSSLDLSGLPNTAIPNSAFQNNTSIKEIQLPAGLTTIGTLAFDNTVLEGTVVLPATLNIGQINNDFVGRFQNSPYITAFEISNGGTTLGNVGLKAIDGVLYSKDETILAFYPCGKPGNAYTVPEGVTTIHAGAFSYNRHLKEVYFPSTFNLTLAGEGRWSSMMDNNTSIENIYVADGNMKFLSANGVMYEKSYATAGNLQNTQVLALIPGGKKHLVVVEGTAGIRGQWMHTNVTGLTFIDLPSTIIELEQNAFNGANNADTLIVRATTPPGISAASLNAVGWRSNAAHTTVYVPAEALDTYLASSWNNAVGGANAFAASQYKGFYDIDITNGTASAPLGSDIAVAGQLVTVTANPATEGRAFSGWTSTTDGIEFNDAMVPVTYFYVPAGGLTSGYTIEITANYKEEIVWTGEAGDDDWTNSANWSGNEVPTAIDGIVIPANAAPTIPLSVTAIQSLTFRKGAAVNMAEGHSVAVGTVMVEYPVESEVWYPVGFPFAVDHIYSEKLNDNLEVYTTENGGHYWLQRYKGGIGENVFEEAHTLTTGEGYIIQFPEYFNNTTIRFVSQPNQTLSNGSTLIYGDYQLLANPNVNHYTVSSNQNNHHYVYDETENKFLLLQSGSKTLSPFEAVITVSSPSYALYQTIGDGSGAGTITGIALPEVNSDPVVATHYYTLQGQEVLQPIENSVYIVKRIYKSQRTAVSKIIYKSN